ncbi:hypothetical protein NEFER03_2143 [Nematocida sp. LUAm3]|nr:hypothetical protein NEFER03_2143 [Nematocida sp. LUAm3]KAI5174614.1 hypothetical protein NEFER02_0735 [Nematocida sp. LUAm2]KAI5177980.1 hypothetical protein NEFER01_1162 [Nematocida sp. LUAm1]
MNEAQSQPEKHISEMLEKLEKKEYFHLIDRAWEVMYNTIIPYNTPQMQEVLAMYTVILKQLLKLPEVSEKAEKLLSVADLLIHPRKSSIVERSSYVEEETKALDLETEVDRAQGEEENKEKGESIDGSEEEAKKHKISMDIIK